MKVKNARAAELSDFEVLSVLKEMDKRQQASVVGGAGGAAGDDAIKTGGLSLEERSMNALPSNLRTIQYEVLETLGNVQRACAHQSAEQIPRFMDAVYAWERGKTVEGVPELEQLEMIEREKRLTKGERLMLVNHAPTTEIELYTLIEEIDDRFTPEQRLNLLTIVAAHLPLDVEAMQAAQALDLTMTANVEQTNVESDRTLEEEGVGYEEDAQEGIQDPDEDMDMLENEARAGADAVGEDEADE